MKFIAECKETEKGVEILFPSDIIGDKIRKMIKKSEDMGRCLICELKPPYKTRTTGEGSQNNKFYALVTEIANATGNDLEDVKDGLKDRAIRRGYPYKINPITGAVKPFSTADVNTVEMSYLIDEALQVCAEFGIVT